MPKKNPARVKLSEEQRTKFTQLIVDQLNRAQSDRGAYIQDGGYLDTWHALYEQTARPESERPFEGAADLVTYLVTEKVDALCSRLVSIMFNADPICVAESWGQADPSRTARVEAFMQWQAEQEKLKHWVAKAIKMALIEQTGILNIEERPVMTKVKRETEVLIQTTAEGAPIAEIVNGKLVYTPKKKEDGNYEEYDGTDPTVPRIKAILTETKQVGFGPQYRVVSLKDFLFLPAVAEDIQDVYGFAERVTMRKMDLDQMVEAGLYDAEAVEKLGEDGDQETTGSNHRHNIVGGNDPGQYAPFELWKLHIQHDIDGDGIPEWLLLTVSLKHQLLLRCDFDTLNQTRYVPFTPFPDPENVYGFSFVGHKLWTIADEHTAIRNMIADRSALATNAPMKRMSNSIYDADDQPFGVGAILDVRDMNDLQQLDIADVPSSAPFLLQHTEQAAERLSGTNDAAVSGVLNGQDRTATEVTAAAQGSYVRVSEAMNYLRDCVSTVYDLRLALWKRALDAREQGIAAPSEIMRNYEGRGVEVPTTGPVKFTKDDLAGEWKFKPRGSVETADAGAMRQDYNTFMANVLPALVNTFPSLGQFRDSPEAARMFVAQAMRLYHVEGAQAIMKAMFAKPDEVQQPVTEGAPAAAGTPAGVPPELAAMLAQAGGGAPPADPGEAGPAGGEPMVPGLAPDAGAPPIPGAAPIQ